MTSIQNGVPHGVGPESGCGVIRSEALRLSDVNRYDEIISQYPEPSPTPHDSGTIRTGPYEFRCNLYKQTPPDEFSKPNRTMYIFIAKET